MGMQPCPILQVVMNVIRIISETTDSGNNK